MLIHPKFDPVAVHLGPVAIHWYGIAYLVGFGLFMLLAHQRLKHEPFRSVQGPGAWSSRDIEDMLFLGVLGVVLGGRLGYCIFYKPGFYLANPLQILFVWQGGMSFHGGLLGVILSQVWFAHSRRKPFWQVMDLVAPCVPPGLGAGRVGNFINGELWGRPADPGLPWAMIFPESGSNIPRHPSQIYELLLEGVLLFIVMWLYARKERKPAQVSAVFLVGYGLARFTAEYFREPDDFLGILALHMSMGQWLSLPMIVAGVALWLWAQARPAPAR
ncbi:MAG: prolipoprotein diacylglyceryl transferase [Burkholderiales bacterium]|nr:prolipoprotein diacylglyceryl transferase [Burkholderiales bacterium]